MAEGLTGMFQVFGVIGTLLIIVLVGYFFVKRVTGSWVLMALLLLGLILYFKNPGLFDLPVPGDVGTVTGIDSAARRNDQRYQQCLRDAVQAELSNNTLLKRFYDGCNTQLQQDISDCIATVQNDPAILDKQAHCRDRMLRDTWAPCVYNSLLRYSSDSGAAATQCQRGAFSGTVRDTAGGLSGQGENKGLLGRMLDWIFGP